MEKVVVVILNYKVKDLTLKCIRSVKNSNFKNVSIILVDNNSTDEIDKELTNDIFFIQTGDNLGYTGGNNIGIKKALSLKADYIFILNPDTTIEANTIGNLVAGLKYHDASIASPKIYFTNSKRIWFAGKILDIKNVLARHIGVNEIDVGQYNQDKEINDATGAAMIVKREVFEKIGLFDEKYFLYYEESDFCFRARKQGYKIMYLHKAVVYHLNAQSTGLGSILQDYYITRNRMLFASKHLSFRTKFALFREALRNLGNPERRLALADFILGNFGKGRFK